jgi:hypothetical protein
MASIGLSNWSMFCKTSISYHIYLAADLKLSEKIAELQRHSYQNPRFLRTQLTPYIAESLKMETHVDPG